MRSAHRWFRTMLGAAGLSAAFLSAPLAADGGLILVPADSSLREWVEAANFISGTVPLSIDAPSDSQRMLSALPLLDADSPEILSKLEAAARAEAGLSKVDGPVPFEYRFTTALRPEFYAGRSDSSIENLFGYNDRSPFVAVPWDVSIADCVALGAIIDTRLNPDAASKTLWPGNGSNFPSDMRAMDFRFPLRSYALARGSFWSLSLSREPVDWGAGENNIYLSQSAGFLDHFYGEIFFKDISYGLLAASLDSTQNGPLGATEIPIDLSNNIFNEIPRTLMIHRLQARFWDKIRISLNEGMMLGGVYPDIRDFIPFYLYHDTYNFSHSSAYTYFEFETVPWKFASFYGSAAFNELQSTFKSTTYPGSENIPNAFALQAGSHAYLPAGPGMIDARAEYTYVNPWMYIRETPATSYSNEHYLGSNVPGSSEYDFPCLGFTYGPDSVLYSARLGYKVPASWSATLKVDYLEKGEQDLSTTYATGTEAAALTSPTGIPQDNLIVGAQGSWRILDFLDLNLSAAYIQRWNVGHVLGVTDWDVQAMVNVGLDCVKAEKAMAKLFKK